MEERQLGEARAAMDEPQRDELYMWEVLELAELAAGVGEMPIAALAVYEDEIIARAINEKEARQDATFHAELLALQAAADELGRWRLKDVTLYCNLEPCPMCAGAMVNSRLGTLVYGSDDPKAGAAGSIIDLVRYPGLNHHLQVRRGVLEAECQALLSDYFSNLREEKKAKKKKE
ncbi:MAG: tRNA adenosine(34) deaminase TadA [Syntrophomonadaceae bacterium]|nr:tRNA adenosine(34) deaminase TadA [Syntrophomonadaceae bacterium]